MLGPQVFLVYINDPANNLASDVSLFADDTSLFTIVCDETVSAQVLNSDLKTVEEWAYQCKMQFSPDVNFLKRDLNLFTHPYCLRLFSSNL